MAICIETKFESGEAAYPLDGKDKKIFKERSINPIKQLEMQRYMMSELLMFDTKFILITDKNINNETYTKYSWEQVFSLMDMSSMPDCINEMVFHKTIGQRRDFKQST